jgi:hypothetical protein
MMTIPALSSTWRPPPLAFSIMILHCLQYPLASVSKPSHNLEYSA